MNSIHAVRSETAMSNTSAPLTDLYREVVMDHHREPHGRVQLAHIDAEAEGKNPSCGDEVKMQLQLDGDRIVALAVLSHGCAISTASGSMLAELLEGRHLDEARQIADTFKAAMHGDTPPAEVDLGDLEALLGVRKFPVRIKCALLPWVTLLDDLLSQAVANREAQDG